MHFTFGGEKSEDYGVYIGRMGDVSIPVTPSSEIVREQVGDRIYTYGKIRQPYTYSFRIYPVKTYWEKGQIERVMDWLDTDTYEPFTRSTVQDRVYYLMLEDSSEITGSSQHRGGIDLTFTSGTPYAHSPVYSQTVELGKDITIENRGHFELYPTFVLHLEERGVVMLTNYLTDTEAIIDNPVGNHIITMNGESKIIESDSNENIYSYFNNDYVKLRKGYNTISTIGKGFVEVFYQFKYKA